MRKAISETSNLPEAPAGLRLPATEQQGLAHTPASLSFSCFCSVDINYAPGLVLSLGQRVGTKTERSLSSGSQGNCQTRNHTSGRASVSQLGLELKLEVQGELTWVIDT